VIYEWVNSGTSDVSIVYFNFAQMKIWFPCRPWYR